MIARLPCLLRFGSLCSVRRICFLVKQIAFKTLAKLTGQISCIQAVNLHCILKLDSALTALEPFLAATWLFPVSLLCSASSNAFLFEKFSNWFWGKNTIASLLFVITPDSAASSSYLFPHTLLASLGKVFHMPFLIAAFLSSCAQCFMTCPI